MSKQKRARRFVMGFASWTPAIAWDDSGERSIHLLTKSAARRIQKEWSEERGMRVTIFELVPVETEET